MALGKYSRVDGRKSTSYCSTISVVVFVAFCLVGIWMFMSSTVTVQDRELPSEETANEVKEQVVTDNNSKQFEDSSGDLQEDATTLDSSGGDAKTVEETQEETASREQSEVETESQNGSDEKTVFADENANSVNGDSNSEAGETDGVSRESNENEGRESDEREENESNDDQTKQKDEVVSLSEEKGEQTQERDTEQSDPHVENQGKSDASELQKETNVENGAWSTQAVESENEKSQQNSISQSQNDYDWKLCNVTAGPDYIPCLDNWQVIRKLPSTKHYEHRERHCPDESPTCLVALPEGYKRPVKWPTSRDKIWYHNIPHSKLAEVKGHQNWVKVTGEYLTFPGGGTQFKNGALHYIDFIQKSVSKIGWGKRSRVILDVGCGVASFGGYLFERDVLAISFAPKDEHEAQVQFALERGIPAISAVMGTKRLPFPSAVFDVIHCARCRVPWHVEGGKLLLELNRVLRPGGYFVWSATPVYQKLPEDVGIWKAMTRLTKSMCWDLVEISKDRLNGVGAAIYRKPTSNECYSNRSRNDPPLCSESDDPNAAWYILFWIFI
ncbi:putative methyltransferase PMT [Parasponia andersonii]|uniref:Methyltransferase n=1 Tax=Parasponia andersonii TaxID=3476 RepID=A0A2P5AVX6_PARAD|nr:putative methyltransferase PMT [Parasponia andersonii]